MNLIEHIHGGYVHNRRVGVLRDQLTNLLPRDVSVLDVGCGDGLLARLTMEQRPDLTISGIDVLVRENSHIHVDPFDGKSLPYPDRSFDVVMFVDVLHHTDDPMILLREAKRVARTSVVLKDHTRNGILAQERLRFMDRIGNARHGVELPFNYWPRERWLAAFAELAMSVGEWRSSLGLYPVPANWLFGSTLHFVARLDIAEHE